MKRARIFLLDTMVLTATSLLVSGVGVWLSLWLSRQLGSEVMGVYQLILSVYGFGTTLATSGIQLATTRLVAEAQGRGVGGILRRCFVYAACFGLAAAGGLFLGAEYIGVYWLKRADTVLPLRALACSLPFLAFSSVLGGYFTAVRRAPLGAVVMIAEQLLRVVLTVAGLTLFGSSLQRACLCIAAATAVAECMGFLVQWWLLLRFPPPQHAESGRRVTRELLGIALPLAVGAYLRTGLLTAKNLLVPIRLQAGGMARSAALSSFGLIHGAVLPILLFPSALLGAAAGLIVPELAQQRVRGGMGTAAIHRMMHRMLQPALLFSLGVAGVLFCFAEPIAALVGHDAAVAQTLRLFAPLIPFMYLDTVVDSMLKGLGEQVSSMRFNIIDSAVSLALVWVLLPLFGTRGYIAVLFVSELLNFALSLGCLLRVTGYRLPLRQAFGALICLLFAAAAVGAVPNAAGAPLFGTLYPLLLCLSGSVAQEDRRWFAALFFRRADRSKPPARGKLPIT